MGVVLTIHPDVRHPLNVPFEIPDPHNGPRRGTWWYRDRKGAYHGPFFAQTWAQDSMDENEPIEPYQDSHRYWWFNDRTGKPRGPYEFFRDCDADISLYVNGALE